MSAATNWLSAAAAGLNCGTANTCEGITAPGNNGTSATACNSAGLAIALGANSGVPMAGAVTAGRGTLITGAAAGVACVMTGGIAVDGVGTAGFGVVAGAVPVGTGAVIATVTGGVITGAPITGALVMGGVIIGAVTIDAPDTGGATGAGATGAGATGAAGTTGATGALGKTTETRARTGGAPGGICRVMTRSSGNGVWLRITTSPTCVRKTSAPPSCLSTTVPLSRMVRARLAIRSGTCSTTTSPSACRLVLPTAFTLLGLPEGGDGGMIVAITAPTQNRR